MLKFLLLFRGRALRDLDGCRKDRGRSDRTRRAGTK
jgi:hypothetical protein